MPFLLCLLFVLLPEAGEAQHYPLPAVGDSLARDAYFYRLFTEHQTLLKRESAVLGKYGWESSEHLEWRRRQWAQDSAMRVSIDAYIVREGFPARVRTRPVPVPVDTSLARWFLEYPGRVDSFERGLLTELPPEIVRMRADRKYKMRKVPKPAVVTFLIMSTAPTFTERCGNLSLLHFEWEAGTINDADFHGYLENTYRARFGEELAIAPGTTERERIAHYLRSLSGCL